MQVVESHRRWWVSARRSDTALLPTPDRDAALLYHAVIPLYYLPGLMERAVLSAPSEFSMQTCGAKFTFAPVLGARQMQMEACL